MILFVNGCVREDSRTLELAKEVLSKEEGEIQEVNLASCDLHPLDREGLLLRDSLIKKKELDHPVFQFAKQFAEADKIIIAAPYWDLMFPAMLRIYFEMVTVSGVTFFYNEHGIPQGLCKANDLIYVTTAGGPIYYNFGYDYIEKLATCFFGIKNTEFVSAQGLDIWGADVAEIMEKAKAEYSKRD